MLNDVYMSNRMSNTPLNQIELTDLDKKSKRLETVLSQHTSLLSSITKNWNIEKVEDMLDAIYEISKKVKKDKKKQFVYGLVEVGVESPLAIAKEIHKPFLELKDHFFGKAIDIPNENKVFKTGEISFLGVKIKQLMNVEDFYETGVELNNCVLGYYNRSLFPKR